LHFAVKVTLVNFQRAQPALQWLKYSRHSFEMGVFSEQLEMQAAKHQQLCKFGEMFGALELSLA
jgi:hypothetical protein